MLTVKLSRLLVTLPLLVVPLSAIAVKPALSAAAAEEAVRILTKARTADQKCNYLSASERSELSRYAARAEIAAASQGSPRSAKAAAIAGKSDGDSQSCSPDLSADVRETLSAAREAVADVTAGTAAAQSRTVKPAKRPASVDAEEPTMRVTGGGLGFYGRALRAYYLERQCRSLPHNKAEQFWKGIVRLHRSTVAANGVKAVARLMRQAQSSASGTSCGSNAEAQIRKGYAEVLSR